jgi:DNA-binding FadR family transcriptional regulator
VVEALAMTLRERVLDGQIDAGAGLTESDVAARYDVSRPTAKTAISLLVHEGLLRRQAPKSAYVPNSSRKDVEDLAALPAGAAHRTFVVADLQLHHALVVAVDSPRLYAGRSGEIHLSMVQATTPWAVTASSPNTAPSWTPWTLPNQARLGRACAATPKEPAMPSQINSTPSPTAPRPPDTRRTQSLRTPSCAAEPSATPVVTATSPPISAHPVSGVSDRAQSLAVSCGSR